MIWAKTHPRLFQDKKVRKSLFNIKLDIIVLVFIMQLKKIVGNLSNTLTLSSTKPRICN